MIKVLHFLVQFVRDKKNGYELTRKNKRSAGLERQSLYGIHGTTAPLRAFVRFDCRYGTNKSAPKPPRCLNCARPMELLRRTSRFGGLPDLYAFTASYVTSGMLRKATQWTTCPVVGRVLRSKVRMCWRGAACAFARWSSVTDRTYRAGQSCVPQPPLD